MSKNSINIYWSPFFSQSGDDWSFLYQKPKTLFSTLINNKVKAEDNKVVFFSCPAISDKFKKTYVFNSSMDSSYIYDNKIKSIQATTPQWMSADYGRDSSITDGPIIRLNLSYIFFADEPVEACFTSPFFHKAQYTNYGSVLPGQFDIGTWFRPYTTEIQTWSDAGEIHIKKDEPLFYVEFKTDKKINFKMFSLNEKLYKYGTACADTRNILKSGSSLKDRYQLFKNVGMREKIILEIKRNLLD